MEVVNTRCWVSDLGRRPMISSRLDHNGRDGRRDWRDVRATAIGLGEVVPTLTQPKTRLTTDYTLLEEELVEVRLTKI